jgi:hypothetical protein
MRETTSYPTPKKSARLTPVKPFLPAAERPPVPSPKQLVATFSRNMRTARYMAAAQSARDELIAQPYADPVGVPFGGPRKPPERGAPGIAGMRADLRDGELSIASLRTTTVGHLAKRYMVSKPSASRAKTRLLAGDPTGWHGKRR